nr:MAG: hypothetical protein CM15mV30_1980 [uncultured marine virus]
MGKIGEKQKLWETYPELRPERMKKKEQEMKTPKGWYYCFFYSCFTSPGSIAKQNLIRPTDPNNYVEQIFVMTVCSGALFHFFFTIEHLNIRNVL